LDHAVVVIENLFAACGGWSSQIWVADNHPMTWLEGRDLVGGSFEAVTYQYKRSAAIAEGYIQIVNIHVEHLNRLDAASLGVNEIQGRRPVVALVVLNTGRCAS
jgi:hypothetical protein